MKVTIKSITTKDIVSYIAEFARVCTHRDQKETSIERDLEFCKTLWKNGHHTPFESINIDFLIEDVSRSLLAQITRYRHASFNVESQRYCKYDKDTKFIQPSSFKDGHCYSFAHAMGYALERYRELIADGAKPEDARCVLPNATPTRFRVVMNLREFFHFYSQRIESHAQLEIRELAKMMLEQILNELNPNECDLIIFIIDSINHSLKNFIKIIEDMVRNQDYDDLNNAINQFKQFI